MANNILTSATFATAFLKPDPGETIDAIYGRKIADNTGACWYRPEKVASYGGFGYSVTADDTISSVIFKNQGTTEFTRWAGFATLSGVCRGTVGCTFSARGTVLASINGTTIVSYSFGAGTGTLFNKTFSIPISGMAVNGTGSISVYTSWHMNSGGGGGGELRANFEKFDVWMTT